MISGEGDGEGGNADRVRVSVPVQVARDPPLFLFSLLIRVIYLCNYDSGES
jgi:hypothetical protein